MANKEYHFEINGTQYTVPNVKDIPTKALAETRKITDELDKAFSLLEIVLADQPETLAALYSLPFEDFGKWQEGWLQNATLGEYTGSES